MNLSAFLSILVLFSGYQPPPVVDRPDLARFFDAEKLSGSFLLYDLKKDVHTAYRYERCQQTFLPASTFKIANTLIGLETGILQDENTPMKWDGVKRDVAAWNQDHTLRSAFQVSCVPCYRELARHIGLERMRTVKGNIPVLDVQYGNVWSNIPKAMIDQLGIKHGETLHVQVFHKNDRLYDRRVPLVNTFGKAPTGDDVGYVNSRLNLSIAVNQGNFSEK